MEAPDTIVEMTPSTTISEIDTVFDSAAGFVNAQHGRLVAAVVWMLDHVSEWQGDGLWTPEAYVRWRTGTSASTASRIVAVARRAGEFPECVAALVRGELSLDQLAPIVRHAPDWCDSQMAGLAARCTVAQITKIARQYPWDLDHPAALAPHEVTDDPTDADADADTDAGAGPPADSEPSGPSVPRPPADDAWFGWDDHGRFRIGANVGADTGLVLEAALVEARSALFDSSTGTDGQVTTVDVLVELANRSLASIDSPARAHRHRVNIFVDDTVTTGTTVTTVTTGNTGTTVTDHRGRPVPRDPARRIMCDPIISPVRWDNAKPVSVGRSQHIVPDRTRRVVEHRDHGCRTPGCTNDRYTEVHHIVHWADGGPTDTANLISLCPQHHRLHHQHRLGITGDADQPDGVVFTDANGHPITESGARPQPPGAPPPPTTGTWKHPLGERLDTRWLHFRQPEPASSQR